MKLDRFIRARQPEGFANVLQRFLLLKLKTTSRANTEHLFESLYPLVKVLPDLQAISHDDLQGERVKLRGRYATGSIRSKLVDWRTFFRWCKKEKLIAVNPAKGLKLPQVRGRDKSASNEDVLEVLRHLAGQIDGLVYRNIFGVLEVAEGMTWSKWQKHTVRDLFMLTFIYETGARAGEVSNLLTRDMEKSLDSPRAGGRVFVIELFGKTEERVRAFTQATAELWRIWCEVRPKKGAKAYALVKWSVKNGLAEPLQAADVSHIMVRRCKQAGVRVFRAHALRHGKAKRAKQYGGLEVAMALLDHNDITSTLFYTRESEEGLDAAALATGLTEDVFTKSKTGGSPEK